MWPAIVPRSTIDNQLIQLVRELQTGAMNAYNGQHDALVIGYRDWADGAVLRLRSNFDEDAIAQLVRTQSFWTIATMSPIDLPAMQLVRSELDEAKRRFAIMIDNFESFSKTWDDPARIVVLDTSAVMAFGDSLVSQDWFALLDQQPDLQLRLVVPLVVIDELDNLKDRGNPTASTKARHALRTLEPLVMPNGRTRLPDVKHDDHGWATIETFSDPPTHRRLASADSEIVRQAAMLKSLTDYPTIVATRDTGMLIRIGDAQLEGRRVEEL